MDSDTRVGSRRYRTAFCHERTPTPNTAHVACVMVNATHGMFDALYKSAAFLWWYTARAPPSLNKRFWSVSVIY